MTNEEIVMKLAEDMATFSTIATSAIVYINKMTLQSCEEGGISCDETKVNPFKPIEDIAEIEKRITIEQEIKNKDLADNLKNITI